MAQVYHCLKRLKNKRASGLLGGGGRVVGRGRRAGASWAALGRRSLTQPRRRTRVRPRAGTAASSASGATWLLVLASPVRRLPPPLPPLAHPGQPARSPRRSHLRCRSQRRDSRVPSWLGLLPPLLSVGLA